MSIFEVFEKKNMLSPQGAFGTKQWQQETTWHVFYQGL